ncbi:MAG: glycosyltransferase family 4 protein, partial [Acidobacteria bacterium]|nr:glycosyltransferase family 4 protein [Acidobacteriota bacterium]
MRVAIDARELHGRPTGVGRLVSGLLTAWETLPAAQAHDFVLCAPDRGAGGTAWEQLVLPALVRRAGADVLFAPAYTGPLLAPVPMLVAIHDVSFAAHPEWFGAREGVRRRVMTRLSAHRAARVLTISRFSQREISARLGIDPGKIHVSYPGVTPPAPATAAHSDAEPLVLFVGSLFTRRHIPALIAGVAELARHRSNVRLDIVGDNRSTPHIDFDRLIGAGGGTGRIRLRAYVDEATLADLYGRARAFVFLSEYEGFGLTPVEALAAGVPVVVLDTPGAREVCDDAACYVAAPDPALVRAALERVLFDETERARILTAAARLLPRYSWRTCAEQVLDVLLA